MTTILTDSMARDHAASIQATAAASRRAREARLARRVRRAAERSHREAARAEESSAGPGAHSAAMVGRIAARPFTALHSWLVAGQL